jgi:hypothetical protein
MRKVNAKQSVRTSNVGTFRDAIRGKVLEAICITNELECHYISLEFKDKTELTITLDTRLTGKLELFDYKTGDARLVRRLGLLPDDAPLWRPKERVK